MAYYISPRFLDKLAVHITKNYLGLPGVRVPLILGVHGRKGEGKTFQCDLVYERMGIEVVAISGGELESPDAGDPARLIRLRYREAAELVKVRGVMAVLMINDLDAGAGRFDAMTQYTVNTQLVNNTLMNIADNPTNVQLPGSYDDQPIQRVPIIVTGNDFSTLYEPLVRDGRMEKFYWQPDRPDRVGIVGGIFAPDNLPANAIETLVNTFTGQAIDFYSALRARLYDEQVRDFIHSVGLPNVSLRVVNSATPIHFEKPNFTLEHLIAVGEQMVAEQRRLQEMRLADQYNRALRERSQPVAPVEKPFYREYSTPSDGASPQAAPSQPPVAPAPPSAPQLETDVVDQVRSLFGQGYRVGMEYADRRHFRANAWQGCSTVQTTDVQAAVTELENCLNRHPQDYVRLIGINPKTKQRVLEQIIQRPG
ncbi:MAG: ribulose bisphosphate carboxylase small subunit [Leptolyngbyaceae cyanobacterium]